VADVIVSFTGGEYWHAGVSSVPVQETPQIKVVTVYSSMLSVFLWPQTLNTARIGLEETFGTAIDATMYFEQAYDSVPVGAGLDRASATLLRAIDVDNAQLVILG
jgi:hypothetical protein